MSDAAFIQQFAQIPRKLLWNLFSRLLFGTHGMAILSNTIKATARLVGTDPVSFSLSS